MIAALVVGKRVTFLTPEPVLLRPLFFAPTMHETNFLHKSKPLKKNNTKISQARNAQTSALALC